MKALNAIEPIKKLNITEEIINRISELVRDGQLALNEKLPSERELCEAFGVSRTVVREALQGLTSMGVLVSEKNNHYVCNDLSDVIVKPIEFLMTTDVDLQSLEMIFEARIALESQVVRIAAIKATDAEIAKIEECLKKADCVSDIEAMQGSMEFHKLISDCTHNPVLHEMYNIVLRIMYEMQNNYNSLKQVHASQEKHRDILDAISDHDPDRAETVARLHLRILREALER